MNFKSLTPRSTIITLIIFLILIGLTGLIVTTILNKNKVIEEKVEVITPPSTIVQEMYNWYMAYKGDPVQNGSYKYVEQLSSSFVNDIDNRSYKGILDYDPFVCNKNKPLGVSVVREDIKDTTATVVVNTDYGEYREVTLKLLLEGKEWKISSIECPQIEALRIKEEERRQNKITLFLTNTSMNASDEDGCGKVYEVKRVVEDTTDPLTVAIKELLKGVDKAEEIQGYTSVFNAQTQEMLKGITISDNNVTIGLRNYADFTSNLTPCDIKSFTSQIKSTVSYYGYNQEVIISE